MRVFSKNLDKRIQLHLDDPGRPQRGVWQDYVEGTAQQLMLRGIEVNGADILLQSDLPSGAGLSSSAALEMAVGLALWTLTGTPVDRMMLAQVGQAAEHQWVGTKCGIMDQYISALAERNHALLIDCQSLEAKRVPLRLQGLSLVVFDTQVKHVLAQNPAYEERQRECLSGLQLLSAKLPEARSLRDVSLEDFRRFAHLLPPLLLKRCRHVITENARTRKAAEALAERDWTVMGQLMFASHESLKDDYEVSCPELDLLVESVAGKRGVIGARMTGAGFGGCTINLVAEDEVEELAEGVKAAFRKRFDHEPAVYVSPAEAGAYEVPSLAASRV